MAGIDLENASSIDFASVQLGYEDFRRLARNAHLTPEEKIAFPTSYRRGHEDAIFADIRGKLTTLGGRGGVVLDIGCGVGGVTDRLIEHCRAQEHELILVDSPEMLEQLPERDGIRKVAGMFPLNADEIRKVAPAGVDAILAYSVLHYVFVDSNPFRFVDEVVDLLRSSGTGLIGDIPNGSKRRRFFSSENGKAYHRAFMKTDTPPEVRHLQVERDVINDAVLAGLVDRAQNAGCHAYVVPQDAALPMANRRDDILLQKP